MAWRSSGASNRDLIENLWRNRLITKPEVKEAFLKVRPCFYIASSPSSPETIIKYQVDSHKPYSLL